MATTSFLLQKHGVLHTDSQDAIRERVTHYLCPHNMRLFDETPLASRMSAVSFDQLSIIELQYGANVEIAPVDESNVYLFRVTLEGQGALVYPDRQVSMVQGGVTVTSPCQRALIQTSQSCHNLIVRIPRHQLEQRLTHRLQQSLKLPILFEHCASAHSPGTEFLLNTIKYFARFSDVHLKQPVYHEQIKLMEGYFYDSLLGLFKHNYSQRLQAESSPLPYHVKSAKQHIDQHLKQGIAINALAQKVGVSTRTLQHGFQQFLGLSPKAYFTQQRMQSVHRTLLEAPRGKRVTEIVLQHGINSPGHFATQYKEVYGVTPVQTLHTNSHHTPDRAVIPNPPSLC
ncbi:AraC family transcriptional regulator [Halomonas halocynthiae]|uniref:AraC family transcriptional regulator n=1 Tax=Halomonas halocynthiae TaxID=176290 RepID=UPI00041C7751|nr:AraC family transcriptional regulator [Halomonas halocynthiae]